LWSSRHSELVVDRAGLGERYVGSAREIEDVQAPTAPVVDQLLVADPGAVGHSDGHSTLSRITVAVRSLMLPLIKCVLPPDASVA